MTKEVDLLSLGKSESTTKSSKGTESTKKEGLSLFDSFVEKSQKDINSSKEQNNKSSDSASKDSQTKAKDPLSLDKSDNKVLEKSEKKEVVLSSNKQNFSLEKNSENEKTSNNQVQNNSIEEKESKKTINSSTSLLDRMILEAKKNVKTISKDEFEENSLKVTNQNINVDRKVDTNENKSSLLDKMVSNAKEESVVRKEEPKVEEKVESKDTKIEIKLETKVELKDEFSDTKIESKDTKIEKVKVDLDVKTQVKDDKLESIQSSVKIAPKAPEIAKMEVVHTEKNIDEDKFDNSKKITEIKESLGENKERKISTKELNFQEVSKENELPKEHVVKKTNSVINELDTKKESKVVKQESFVEKSEEKNTNKELNNFLKTEISEMKVDKKKQEQNLDTTLNDKKLEVKKIDSSKQDSKQVISEVKNEDKTLLNNNNDSLYVKEKIKFDEKSIVKEEQRVNISKNELLNTKEETMSEKPESKSLMDRLLDNAGKNSVNKIDEVIDNRTLHTQTSKQKNDDVLTNIFLGTQKNSIYNRMLANKSEGVKVAKEASTLGEVKKSAEILELGLKETSIKTESVQEPLKKASTDMIKDKFLDKLAFEKNFQEDRAFDQKIELQKSSTIATTNSVSTTNALQAATEEAVVNINVNQNLAISIQSRIIGAQQQMSSMMSDIARNMYENYRPPITAFRINLFPAQLGHIAILMKNDKENSLSISLNMSNSNTLESFVESQGLLREALNRSFNNTQTSFDLSFNMQNQDSNNQPSQGDSQQEQQRSNSNVSSNDVLEAINENQNVGQDLNYL